MSFCIKCGNPVEDHWKVCTTCGTPIAPDQTQPVYAQHPQGYCVQPQVSSPNAPRNKAVPVIIGGVVVAVIAIVLCAMVALGVGPFAPSGNSATLEVTASSSTNTNGSTVTNQSTPEPSFQGFDSINEGGGESSAESGMSINNDDDCYTVNIFLSNFTEKGKSNYKEGSWSVDDYANWAYYHCLYNAPSYVEYYGSASDWSQSAKSASLTARVSSETIAHYVSVFFKTDINPGATSQWLCAGGYNYFMGTKYLIPQGVAHATAITSLGNGRYQVSFDVYGPTGMSGYDVLEKDLYSASPSELMAKFGTSAPKYSGTAVIEEGYEGIAPFKLISLTY